MKKQIVINKKIRKNNRKISLSKTSKLLAEFFNGEIIEFNQGYTL